MMKPHSDLKFRVEIGDKMFKEFSRKRGLRQGDPAAGILCITVLSFVHSDAQEDLATLPDEEVRQHNADNPIKYKEALYADDAAIPGLASQLKLLQE